MAFWGIPAMEHLNEVCKQLATTYLMPKEIYSVLGAGAMSMAYRHGDHISTLSGDMEPVDNAAMLVLAMTAKKL